LFPVHLHQRVLGGEEGGRERKEGLVLTGGEQSCQCVKRDSNWTPFYLAFPLPSPPSLGFSLSDPPWAASGQHLLCSLMLSRPRPDSIHLSFHFLLRLSLLLQEVGEQSDIKRQHTMCQSLNTHTVLVCHVMWNGETRLIATASKAIGGILPARLSVRFVGGRRVGEQKLQSKLQNHSQIDNKAGAQSV
jgi:hypothetical protein